MKQIRLTNDADFLLCILYRAYVDCRKTGELREEAICFGGSEYIQKEYAQSWPTNDIDEAARELDRKGMICALFSDDSLHHGFLTDDGIIYMERRFGDRMDQLLQRITSVKSSLFI